MQWQFLRRKAVLAGTDFYIVFYRYLQFRYAKALSDNNILYELHLYPYGWHGLSTVDNLSCDFLEEKTKLAHSWISEVNEWLKFVL